MWSESMVLMRHRYVFSEVTAGVVEESVFFIVNKFKGVYEQCVD